MADNKHADFNQETLRENVKSIGSHEGTGHRLAQSKILQGRASKRSMLERRKPSCRTRHSQKADRREKVGSSTSGLLSNPTTVSKADCDGGAIPIPLSSSKHLPPPSLSCPSSSVSASSNSAEETSEHKRPRPGVELQLLSDASSSAPPNCCDLKSHAVDKLTSIGLHSSENRAQFSCESALLDKRQLYGLLSREMDYHPNNAFLYYVDPELEDKVDAGLRNDAVHNLRFMHNVCFNLSTDTFCKAVNLIDRFIVKVKVKPKYIACVATACYCAASKLTCSKSEFADLPSPEALVQLTRCGGNASDLVRMEDILRSKLCHDMDGVNAFDFLRIFTDCLVDNEEAIADANQCQNDSSNHNQDKQHLCTGMSEYHSIGKGSTSKRGLLRRTQLTKRLETFMEIALCYLEVYRFRPACLALSILAQCDIDDLLPIANLCEVDWVDVCDCADLVDRLYNRYLLPRHRRQLAYTASRRALFRIGYSCPTPLDTISEDNEPADEDEWLLPSLFEP